jgi:subfamily B ATP-binding cassette protein MsbA
MDFFNKMRSGLLMSRITNDTRGMQMALSSVSSDVFKQPVTIIGGIAVLLWMDWKFTIVTLVLFPSCLVPLSMYGKRARRAVNNEQLGMAEMVVTMQESFAGIRVIKSFAREEQQEKDFRRSNQSQFSNSMRILRSMEAVSPLVETIAAMGVALALLYVYVESLPAAKFIALLGGIFLLYEPIKTLSRMHITMQRSIASTIGIFEVLIQNRPSSMPRPLALKIQYSSTPTRALLQRRKRTVKISTCASSGKSCPRGTTKAPFFPSSCVSTIRRPPRIDKLRFDPIETRNTSSFRRTSFHDTILKNIQFGRLDATKEEIQDAAKAANAHDFIMAQPKGYETLVGDKGCLLSGGQQQRLAIARALLKNAPILLLDEATSALDSESEQQIQLALERLAQGRTVIAIAHRLSTIFRRPDRRDGEGPIKEMARTPNCLRTPDTIAASTICSSTAIPKNQARK